MKRYALIFIWFFSFLGYSRTPEIGMRLYEIDRDGHAHIKKDNLKIEAEDGKVIFRDPIFDKGAMLYEQQEIEKEKERRRTATRAESLVDLGKMEIKGRYFVPSQDFSFNLPEVSGEVVKKEATKASAPDLWDDGLEPSDEDL